MKTRWLIFPVCMHMLLMLCIAQQAWALDKTTSYREAKALYERLLAGNPTQAEHLDMLRDLVRASRYGDRGLNRIFKNFENSHTIDPRIPGVGNAILKLRSASVSQAKGALRELLYAIDIHNDPRFKLIEMNRQINRPWGKTDADIIFYHNRSNTYIRMEVKDVSLNSQRADIKRIKKQIDKMALEYKRTGQPQVLANRRELLPEIKEYARKKGVHAYDNVSTSSVKRNGVTSLEDVKNDIDRMVTQQQYTRAIQGGIQIGFGLMLLYRNVGNTWDDLKTIFGSEGTPDFADWLRLGEHGSQTLAGTGMVLSGGSLAARQFIVNEAWQGRLFKFGRIGGAVSLAAFAIGEAVMIGRFIRGDVSQREFVTAQWAMGASLAGGWAGAWLGGILGSALTVNPVGTTIGAAGGGAAGGWIAMQTSNYFTNMYYDWKYGELDKRFAQYVCARYDVTY